MKQDIIEFLKTLDKSEFDAAAEIIVTAGKGDYEDFEMSYDKTDAIKFYLERIKDTIITFSGDNKPSNYDYPILILDSKTSIEGILGTDINSAVRTFQDIGNIDWRSTRVSHITKTTEPSKGYFGNMRKFNVGDEVTVVKNGLYKNYTGVVLNVLEENKFFVQIEIENGEIFDEIFEPHEIVKKRNIVQQVKKEKNIKPRFKPGDNVIVYSPGNKLHDNLGTVISNESGFAKVLLNDGSETELLQHLLQKYKVAKTLHYTIGDEVKVIIQGEEKTGVVTSIYPELKNNSIVEIDGIKHAVLATQIKRKKKEKKMPSNIKNKYAPQTEVLIVDVNSEYTRQVGLVQEYNEQEQVYVVLIDNKLIKFSPAHIAKFSSSANGQGTSSVRARKLSNEIIREIRMRRSVQNLSFAKLAAWVTEETGIKVTGDLMRSIVTFEVYSDV